MITLYGFGRVHPGMIGEGRDLRTQWALEETGLPYRVHALDYIAGELDGREWIACEAFTVADILLATVLREVRHTDLIEPYPRLKAYYARALARPAWQRTLSLCAERQGVTVADIR
jgi:glutathione S-transferase